MNLNYIEKLVFDIGVWILLYDDDDDSIFTFNCITSPTWLTQGKKPGTSQTQGTQGNYNAHTTFIKFLLLIFENSLVITFIISSKFTQSISRVSQENHTYEEGKYKGISKKHNIR